MSKKAHWETISVDFKINPHSDGVHCGKCHYLYTILDSLDACCRLFRPITTPRLAEGLPLDGNIDNAKRHKACLGAEAGVTPLVDNNKNRVTYDE